MLQLSAGTLAGRQLVSSNKKEREIMWRGMGYKATMRVRFLKGMVHGVSTHAIMHCRKKGVQFLPKHYSAKIAEPGL